MKIAGWEVPQALIDAVAKQLRAEPFDAGIVRLIAASTDMLPRYGDPAAAYVREEIGTRLIDYFRRSGNIAKVPGTRRWRWVQDSTVDAARDGGGS
ncbi:hypothetical protein MMZ06_34735 [Burkholderia gladioli]|uniref:hypothetical protein n=1 Tax=Burkholderia gladioli TaxID=28095 RepID=UPI001F4BB621|nr:hypothetical protein [Burkholderia gladioli]MCH7274992.1 hypothetical protein [Burkholderia gladioli]